MQKWEYKVVLRERWYQETANNTVPLKESEWKTTVDSSVAVIPDFERFLNDLGQQGWELVSVVAESGLLGGLTSINGFVAFGGGQTQGATTDYAGFTNVEKLYFKRLIS
jgi:hypothetical protein